MIASPLVHLNTGTALAIENADLIFPSPLVMAPHTLGLTNAATEFGPVTHSWLQDVLGDRAFGHGEITWFERIHVEPYYLDLGFLILTQTIVVRVWNSDRYSERTASSYAVEGDEGATLDDPPTFPLRWSANQQRAFDFLVSEDGPPQFTNRLVFTVTHLSDDLETDLNVEGIRVVPFPIDPSGEIVEGYGYLTRIISSLADDEQRAALREIPRRSWSFEFVMVGVDQRIASALLHGWASQPFGLPIWYEETRTTAVANAGATSISANTTLRDWGELAILWASPTQFEAVLIDSVSPTSLSLGSALLSTWPANTRLYPVRLARIESQQQLERRGLDVALMRATFRGEDWAAT